MKFLLLASFLFLPAAVFANPPLAVSPTVAFPAPVSSIPPASAFVLPPSAISVPSVLSVTPPQTPLVPLAPLLRPDAVFVRPDLGVQAALPDVVSVIARWNASVTDPGQRIYVHPDAARFTLTVGGNRILPSSSYAALWVAVMRSNTPVADLSEADARAARDFADSLVAYQVRYRAAWERGQGSARPTERPADPLQAALWDLNGRIVAINASNNPRLMPASNAFLRSVDMHRLFNSVEKDLIGDTGMNMAKALWQYDLSFTPVGSPYPRGVMIFDNRTGRSLSLPDYIAAGFPSRIK